MRWKSPVATRHTEGSKRKDDPSEIFMANIHHRLVGRNQSQKPPRGFVCDIGAPKSVVGRKTLNRILNENGVYKRHIRPSQNRFRFANSVFESRGKITIPLRTPLGIPPVNVDLDIVDADIPALLGMDVMDRELLTPCTITNRLIRKTPQVDSDGTKNFVEEWSVPLLRSRSNHLYAHMDLSTAMYFTRSQLLKLHRQFFHPSAQKLFNLLRRSRPDEATPETLRVLQDISSRCDPCQRIQHAPTRFRVSLGAEGLRFNERVMMDIMVIDGNPVLHIVDEATRFSAASYLPNSSTETVWKTILKCWATIYTGLPNRILTDQGTQFQGRFVDLARAADVDVSSTGIEAHSSLGLCERYHEPLRTTVRKIMVSFPSTEKELALACAVKAMNDTLGPEGLVPSALVFGEYPQIRARSENATERPTTAQRGEVAEMARKEMSRIMATMKTRRALHHAVPPSCDRTYELGDKVLIWREKQVSQRIGEWLGPFEVNAVDYNRKLVFVRDVKIGQARPFNVAQVKPYLSPEVLSYLLLTDIEIGLSCFKSPVDSGCYMTEIIDPTDDRATSKEMQAAKKLEIKNLLERGTFRVLLKEEIPQDGNVLPGRFVLAIKSTIDGKVKYKARYVIGGHKDRMKGWMVHSSTTIQPQSVRLLFALTSMFGFNLWTADIRQAYLQTAEPFLRDIYIEKPVPEFELGPDECLKLLRPLYGLCDAGDLWHATLDKHHRLDMNMKAFRIDPAFYYMMEEGVLKGLSGTYVDDLIRSGDQHFKQVSKKTNEKFEMTEDGSLPAEFTGFVIDRDTDGNFYIDQIDYLRKIECIPYDASFGHFRSMRMRLAWLSNSRPDCLFEISQLTQVTEKMFEEKPKDMIVRLNKAVKYATGNRVRLKVPKLDKKSVRVVGFADSSFANNADLSSQLGQIIFLVDKFGNSAPITFKSYKARRITRSAMSGEVIAFSDMFDTAIAVSKELSVVMNQRVPVQLLTDSKSLFDVISKGSRTSEKRTMLDIAAAREGFRDKLISDIGFVRSSMNLADGLTKSMNQARLREVITSGHLDISPELWIIRKD